MKTNKIHNNSVSWGCMINRASQKRQMAKINFDSGSKMHIPFLFVEMVQCFLLGFSCSKILLFQEKKIEASERERSGRKLWLSFSPLEKVVQPRCKRSSMYSFYAENSFMKPQKVCKQNLTKNPNVIKLSYVSVLYQSFC